MKTFQIKVVTGAKENRIIQNRNFLKVYVSVPPEKGKANYKVIELVADFFKVRVSQVKIIKGMKSKDKIIAVST